MKREIVLAPRNDPIGFARRTRKNLEFIREGYKGGQEVHVITKLIVSLLGLIVFPWEKRFYNKIAKWELKNLQEDGWPTCTQLLGETKTLGDLIYHLRNAVCHRRVTFSSDSRDIENVSIEFADHKSSDPKPYWRAEITGDQLHALCTRLMDLIEAP